MIAAAPVALQGLMPAAPPWPVATPPREILAAPTAFLRRAPGGASVALLAKVAGMDKPQRNDVLRCKACAQMPVLWTPWAVGIASVVAAPILAFLMAALFGFNAELMETMARGEVDHAASPLVNLLLVHSTGILFAPVLLRGPPPELSKTTATWMPMAAMGFSLLMMAFNWLYVKSSQGIDLNILNVIFQSSVAFVYVASVLFFGEPVTCPRLFGVILAMGGCVLATPEGAPSHAQAVGGLKDMPQAEVVGYILALGAALGFTIYQVLMRFAYSDAKSSPNFIIYFMGWIGLMHAVAITPLVVVADRLGFEHMQLPTTSIGVSMLATSAALGLCVNLLQLTMVLFCGPMTLSAAMALTMPVSVFLDYAVRGISPPSTDLIGTLLVIIAFVLLLAPTRKKGEVPSKSQPQDEHYVQPRMTPPGPPVLGCRGLPPRLLVSQG